MKTFKIKDLMVSIATEKDLGQAYFCPQQTCIGFTPPITGNCCKLFTAAPSCHNNPCSFLASFKQECPVHTAIPCTGFSCAGGSRVTDWITETIAEKELVLFQENELAELKVQLAHLQKQIDIKLQHSPEELNQLEGKLGEALHEIRVQKANLSKGK
ncbi:MAG TPA: hypothetical protein PLA68_02265 [Panacibacter sp.]|nr:hypothetical protein [Panacibacter sp.]